MLLSPLQVSVGVVATDTSILSSVAIILGAVFVVYQIKEDKKLLQASIRSADANAAQARITMQQFVQNNNLATMDLVMRLYEFADSMEVTQSYIAVVRSRVKSYEEFLQLPESKQLAFFQVASLFESLGFLVDKGFVQPEIVDDMFATKTAWEALEPFIKGMRKQYSAEDYYFFFERLHNRLSSITTSTTGEFLARRQEEQAAARGQPPSKV